MQPQHPLGMYQKWYYVHPLVMTLSIHYIILAILTGLPQDLLRIQYGHNFVNFHDKK